MSWIQTDRHKHRCMSWVNFIHSAEDSPTQSVWQCDCFPENNVFWMLEKLSPSYVHRTGWAWRCLISGSYAEVDHHMGMVRQRNIKDWVYGIYWSQKNLWTQWILRAEWRSYGRKFLSTVLDLIHCRANRSYSHTMKGWFMGLSHSIYRKMTSVGKGWAMSAKGKNNPASGKEQEHFIIINHDTPYPTTQPTNTHPSQTVYEGVRQHRVCLRAWS